MPWRWLGMALMSREGSGRFWGGVQTPRSLPWTSPPPPRAAGEDPDAGRDAVRRGGEPDGVPALPGLRGPRAHRRVVRDPPWDPSQTPPRPPVCPPLMLCPLPRLTPGLEPALQDDRAFVFTNGTLRLGPAARGDGGPFTCRAHNAHSNASVIAHLDVKGTGTPGDPSALRRLTIPPGCPLFPWRMFGIPKSFQGPLGAPPGSPQSLLRDPRILPGTSQSSPVSPRSFPAPPRASQGPLNPSWDSPSPPVPSKSFLRAPQSLSRAPPPHLSWCRQEPSRGPQILPGILQCPPKSFRGSPRAS